MELVNSSRQRGEDAYERVSRDGGEILGAPSEGRRVVAVEESDSDVRGCNGKAICVANKAKRKKKNMKQVDNEISFSQYVIMRKQVENVLKIFHNPGEIFFIVLGVFLLQLCCKASENGT